MNWKYLRRGVWIALILPFMVFLAVEFFYNPVPQGPYRDILPPSVFTIDSLIDARGTTQQNPPRKSKIVNNFSEGTGNFEIRILDYEYEDNSGYNYCVDSLLEVKTKLDDMWKRLSYHAFCDSVPYYSDANQITIFSDTEVGVSGFDRGYYFSQDSGQTWHFWSPYQILSYDVYGYLYGEGWSILSTGEGEMIVSTRDKHSIKTRVFTFSTTDKGLTWQLTKEEVPPPE